MEKASHRLASVCGLPFFPSEDSPFRESKAGEWADIQGVGADFLADIDSCDPGTIADLLDDASSQEEEASFRLGLGISPQCVTRAMSEVSDENDGSESMKTPKESRGGAMCTILARAAGHLETEAE